MKEDPYTRVPNDVIEAIAGPLLTRLEIRVLLCIARKTWGWSKKNDDITVTQIARLTKMDRGNCSKALAGLVAKRAVLKHHGRYGYTLEINKKTQKWRPCEINTGRVKTPRRVCEINTGGVVNQHGGCVKTPHTKETPQKKLPKETPQKKVVKPNAPPVLDFPVPKKPAEIDVIREVFAHWQIVMNHPRSKLDEKRTKKIRLRLKDGYSKQELCAAIDGCAKTPWNMGLEGGTVYDDIELICRDATHVDRFLKHNDNPPPISTTTAHGREQAFSQTVSDFVNSGGNTYDAE